MFFCMHRWVQIKFKHCHQWCVSECGLIARCKQSGSGIISVSQWHHHPQNHQQHQTDNVTGIGICHQTLNYRRGLGSMVSHFQFSAARLAPRPSCHITLCLQTSLSHLCILIDLSIKLTTIQSRILPSGACLWAVWAFPIMELEL